MPQLVEERHIDPVKPIVPNRAGLASAGCGFRVVG